MRRTDVRQITRERSAVSITEFATKGLGLIWFSLRWVGQTPRRNAARVLFQLRGRRLSGPFRLLDERQNTLCEFSHLFDKLERRQGIWLEVENAPSVSECVP